MYNRMFHHAPDIAAGQNRGVLSRRSDPQIPAQVRYAWDQNHSPKIMPFLAYEIGSAAENNGGGNGREYYVVAALISLDEGHALAARVGMTPSVLNMGQPISPEVHDLRCALLVELPEYGSIEVPINGDTYLITPQQISALIRSPYNQLEPLLRISSGNNHGRLDALVAREHGRIAKFESRHLTPKNTQKKKRLATN